MHTRGAGHCAGGLLRGLQRKGPARRAGLDRLKAIPELSSQEFFSQRIAVGRSAGLIGTREQGWGTADSRARVPLPFSSCSDTSDTGLMTRYSALIGSINLFSVWRTVNIGPSPRRTLRSQLYRPIARNP
jgi:hypothetical protein